MWSFPKIPPSKHLSTEAMAIIPAMFVAFVVLLLLDDRWRPVFAAIAFAIVGGFIAWGWLRK